MMAEKLTAEAKAGGFDGLATQLLQGASSLDSHASCPVY